MYNLFLQIFFMFFATFWSIEPALAQAVRKSIDTLNAQELLSLRRGVSVMMSRNSAPRYSADFRRSWIYWANMHSHFGSDCAGGITGAGMGGVQTWQAINSNETATWCQCEHDTVQFLTWHRMYLYYFERVLQQAAGNASLRLPFWDYESDGKLPTAFRDATYVDNGVTRSNPLRVTARRAALNNGSAGLSKAVTSTSNAMAAATYTSFTSRLEDGPHGPVHCSIGVSGCRSALMGSVPVSALDPIFYVHHANIDRLYDCWLQVDEAARLPSGSAVLNRQFSFIDSDGSQRTRAVRDMLRTSQLGYRYPVGGGCPSGAAPEIAVAQASLEANKGAALPESNTLGPRASAASLTVDASVKEGAAGTGTSGRPVFYTVVIEGLTAVKIPGALFDVFLADATGRRTQIGVIDFFSFGAHSMEHAHGQHAAEKSFEFDATAAIEALGLTASSPLKLIFIPTTGLTNSTAEEAARAVPSDAGIRFQRASLRVEP